MTVQTILAFRVPLKVRDRLNAIAARRGSTAQDLLGELVCEFVENADAEPPLLTDALDILLRNQALLRRKGIRRLSVFGSVARGSAVPGSDVDLAVEFEDGRELFLNDFSSLREDLQDLLNHPVDLVDWQALREEVRKEAERDAVDVLSIAATTNEFDEADAAPLMFGPAG